MGDLAGAAIEVVARKRGLWLLFALPVLLLAAACAGSDDASSGTASNSATAGAITTVEGHIFDTIDECLQPTDVKVVDGKIDPPLTGFAVKLPGDAFRLERAYFATIGSCNPDAGKRVLRTVWRHRGTGILLYVEEDEHTSTGTGAGLLAMTSANFTSDDMAFWLVSGHDMVVDSTGRGSPSSRPTTPDPKDLALQQGVIEAAVANLAPEAVRKCMATQRVGSSWSDLKAYGVGDPTKLLPDGYKPIQFELLFTDYPECNPPPHASPAFELQAKWNSPRDRLLGIDVSALVNPLTPAVRTEPGRFQWSNGRWHADVIGDLGAEGLKAIALAIDPSVAEKCGRTSQPATFEDLAAWHIHDIQPPDRFKVGQSQSVIFGPTTTCGGPATGARAFWMFDPDDLSANGLIVAGAFAGHQYFMPPEDLLAPYAIYWKGSNGVQYYVAGFKWGNSTAFDDLVARPIMLAVAHELDPSFSESKLEPPPAFEDLYEP